VSDAKPAAGAAAPGPVVTAMPTQDELERGKGTNDGQADQPAHQDETGKPPLPPASDVPLTETEAAIASAFADSHDGTTFAAELDKRGITLACVTPADIASMKAETAANPGRRFPVVMVLELVAVDRFGDVHKLNPDRQDAEAIEDRFDETRVREVEVQPVAGSIAEAHAAFGARYALSGMARLRAVLRTRIAGVRAHLADAAKGDTRATVSALGGLTDLIHLLFANDTPADSLNAALAALAAGRTDDVRKALEAARASLIAGQTGAGTEPGGVVVTVQVIESAESTLAAGDRADCQRLIETALEMADRSV
jgi:hypothetical protein